MVVAVCYAFIFLFEILSCYMFFENRFVRQVSNKTCVLIYGLSFILQYLLSFLQVPAINLSLFVLSTAFIIAICYKEKLKSVFFSTIMLTIFMLITEIIVVHCSSILLNIDFSLYQDNIIVLMSQSSLSKLFFFAMVYLVSKISNRKALYCTNKYAILLSILPVTSVVIIHLIAFLGASTKISTMHSSILAISSILLLFANLFVFYIYESVQKANYNETQFYLEQQKWKISNEYYELLSKEHEKSRILIHDIKKHLQYIENKTISNEPKNVLDYIDSIRYDFGLADKVIYSGNKLVDVIINRYAQESKNFNLDYSIESHQVDLNFMNNSDIIALLGNIFDNAIESAKLSDKKVISFLMTKKNHNFIVIEMCNSCDNTPLHSNGQLISSKPLKNEHGIGIKSVKRIVDKYNGDFSWSYDENNNIFKTTIVLATSIQK